MDKHGQHYLIEKEAQLTSDRVRHRMKRHRISHVDIDTVYDTDKHNDDISKMYFLVNGRMRHFRNCVNENRRSSFRKFHNNSM